MNQSSAVRTRSPSTPLERGLFALFRLAVLGGKATAIGLVGYLAFGFLLHISGIYDPMFHVMTLSDPVFVTLTFLVGGFICILSGSLTLLTLLVSVHDANADFVILMSLIALGFGSAAVRMTVGPVHECLSAIWGV
jgi:hypothetical protein